jgi:hypothetical protein
MAKNTTPYDRIDDRIRSYTYTYVTVRVLCARSPLYDFYTTSSCRYGDGNRITRPYSPVVRQTVTSPSKRPFYWRTGKCRTFPPGRRKIRAFERVPKAKVFPTAEQSHSAFSPLSVIYYGHSRPWCHFHPGKIQYMIVPVIPLLAG